MTRRELLLAGMIGALGMPISDSHAQLEEKLPEPSAEKLPRWRGFNLLEKFQVSGGANRRFQESDFAWMEEWGFDFVRLPMDYRCWIENGDWTKIREDVLKEIDEALSFGEKHGVHVCVNFHRAPGYTVASPPEEKSVWTEEEARRVCALHWATFARRYQGVPNSRLSFNLFNEPGSVEAAAHRATVVRMVEAIRQHDPERLIICDGRQWGNTPPTELLCLGVAAATRGYQPMRISHYKATWVGGEKWPEPSYPLKEGDVLWNRESMRQRLIEPWKELESRGVGVIVGEFGAFSYTPHTVVLNWLTDLMGLWREAGWGWAMWNLRGGFGVVDSGRTDVSYEDFHGHKLDRKLLDLLRSH